MAVPAPIDVNALGHICNLIISARGTSGTERTQNNEAAYQERSNFSSPANAAAKCPAYQAQECLWDQARL